MRLPVNGGPAVSHPSVRASDSLSRVSPMPLSSTNRVSTPPAVTGSVTRCSKRSNGTICINRLLSAYYAPMHTAAILGCAGYTGQETLDRLLAHPELEPVALGSDSLAGQSASTLDPRLNGDLPPFVTNAEALKAGADAVFLCLGHEAAAAIEPPDAELVVDLSGAHRLRDASLYATWYGFEHPRPGAW